LHDFSQHAVNRSSIKDRRKKNKESLHYVVILAVEIMNTAYTAKVSDDLEDSSKDKGDEELLTVFAVLDDV